MHVWYLWFFHLFPELAMWTLLFFSLTLYYGVRCVLYATRSEDFKDLAIYFVPAVLGMIIDRGHVGYYLSLSLCVTVIMMMARSLTKLAGRKVI